MRGGAQSSQKRCPWTPQRCVIARFRLELLGEPLGELRGEHDASLPFAGPCSCPCAAACCRALQAAEAPLPGAASTCDQSSA
jgi:hypothetical protein